MYRVWYSTEGLADFIIENTNLKLYPCKKYELLASDADTTEFHAMPEHIKQILELDCPDLIVEKEYGTYYAPVLSIEVSGEAGTGHDAFQRFARIVAAVEHGVPSMYIFPKAKIVTRDGKTGWDKLNPLVFYALDELMETFDIPSLFYYFPSDYDDTPDDYTKSAYLARKGLNYSLNPKYPECPNETDADMQEMFSAINILIDYVEKPSDRPAFNKLLKEKTFKKRRRWMQKNYNLMTDKDVLDQSPNTATITVPTEYLINYLKTAKPDYLKKTRYSEPKYDSLLLKREETVIYMPDTSEFRADPYAGCLTAIDYMQCRTGTGLTFEDREKNLVLAFGKVSKDDVNKTLCLEGKLSIEKFFANVIYSEKRNLLKKEYKQLKPGQIPRYYMQVRHGSTYSKNKAIRIYAHFADAILFKDGALWREN